MFPTHVQTVHDEATSALDSDAEEAIKKIFRELMQGKTVIAIAHRLSTIAELDRLSVIDQGKLVEEGTHEQLVKASGLYTRFWEHQSGGFLGLEERADYSRDPTAPESGRCRVLFITGTGLNTRVFTQQHDITIFIYKEVFHGRRR